MTTYVPIPDGDIDQDSPVTQPLMTAMRDNPIAITEGSSGAPRIQAAALGDSVSSGGVQTCLRDLSPYTTTSTSWSLAMRWSVYNGGSVRVGFRHRADGASTAAEAKVEKNANVQNSWSTGSTTYVDRQVAVNINSGDTLDIWVRTDFGATYIDNIYMSTSGGFMIPAPIQFARGEPKWFTS